jgi:hypothetical protein
VSTTAAALEIAWGLLAVCALVLAVGALMARHANRKRGWLR